MEYILASSTIAIGLIDAKSHRIPNGLLIFLSIFVVIESYLKGGLKSVGIALLMFILYFTVATLIYLLRGIGGGDVKFIAILGAWLGLADTYLVIVIAACICSIVGAFVYYKKGILKQRITVFWRGIYLKLLGTKGDVGFNKVPTDPNAPVSAIAAPVPMGTCLAVSVLIISLI